MIGSPLLFGNGDRPSEPVTPVKWIRSDGVSYLNLGLPSNDFNWRLMFTFPRPEEILTRTSNPIVVGTDGATTPNEMSYGIEYQLGSDTWSDYFDANSNVAAAHLTITSPINTASLTEESPLFFEYHGENNPSLAHYVYFNRPFNAFSGGKYTPGTSITYKQFVSSVLPISVTMYLFGVPNASSRTNVKVRGITFYTHERTGSGYKNVDVYRQYIPALKGGVAGLYDLVTKTFIGNAASSGALLYGNN